MKMIQFAIASIVDANTGSGLSHGVGKIDYAAAEAHGRRIRARSIADLFAALGDRIAALAEDYRDRSRNRRELSALRRLNDHLLRDIGIGREDLLSIELGATSLSELGAQKRARQAATVELISKARSTARVEGSNRAVQSDESNRHKEALCA